jgi:hypothetical protein
MQAKIRPFGLSSNLAAAAQRNYLGAATGPGRNPADAICNFPDGDAPLLFAPVAHQRFRILDAEDLSGRQ